MQPQRAAASHRSLGQWGEEVAARYLSGRGWQILGRNCRFGHGELDLVALDAGVIVFVEVKTRRSTRFGQAHEAVHGRKAQRLWALGEAWLCEHGLHGHPCRFDVLAIEVTSDGRALVRLLQGAFRGDP